MGHGAAAPIPIATLLCVYAKDRSDLFGAALDSVLAQQLDANIVSRIYLGVDGPLPPALEAVISERADRLFEIHRSPERQGLARTLNALLQRLQDEAFLFRMDADDWSLPQRYARQLAHLQQHPDIDILGTAITEVDEASGQERCVRFASGPDDAIARLHRRVPVAHPTVCLRRHVFECVSGYPERGTNEDVALWFACAAQGLRFDNLPDSLLRYRVSATFWQRRGWRKAGSELMCYLRGIHRLHGWWTLDYAFPLLRFLMRVSPAALSRLAYRSTRLRGVHPPG